MTAGGMSPPPARRSAPSQRILVRGVNWLGDAIMTTPALQRLREARPDAHITLLTHRKLADLWQHHPAVDAITTFSEGEGIFQVARRLRGEQFDLALLLPNSPRSALEVFLAGVPQRIGYAQPWRNLLLTHRVTRRAEAMPMRKRSVAEIRRSIATPAAPPAQPLPAAAHHMHHYLHLVAGLGANPEPIPPRLFVTEGEVQKAKSLLPSNTPPNQSWFGLNAGAEYGPAKRWPSERFIAAAIELHRRTGCGWLVLGGPRDVPLASEIVASLHKTPVDPVVNFAGRTTLRELCATLKLCSALLTNDSGPMHVAAAVGTPVVVPFGSTSPELTGPGLLGEERHFLLTSGVPCAPCFRRECPIDFRCMTGIAVEQVVSAMLSAVSQRTQSGPARRAGVEQGL